MKKRIRITCAVIAAAVISTFTSGITAFAKEVSEYTDVHEGDWFYNPVADVTARGLMTGTNDTTFAPAQNLERGQLASILYRMDGSPETSYGYRFPDVADGIFYSVPITWAYDAGVISGYNNGYFGPSDQITREQLATMLYRYAGKCGYDRTSEGNILAFPDGGDVSDFAYDAMKWAVGKGIILGEADGRLNPQGDVSRAVAATMISRLVSGIDSEVRDHDHLWEVVYEKKAVYVEKFMADNQGICNSCSANLTELIKNGIINHWGDGTITENNNKGRCFHGAYTDRPVIIGTCISYAGSRPSSTMQVQTGKYCKICGKEEPIYVPTNEKGQILIDDNDYYNACENSKQNIDDGTYIPIPVEWPEWYTEGNYELVNDQPCHYYTVNGMPAFIQIRTNGNETIDLENSSAGHVAYKFTGERVYPNLSDTTQLYLNRDGKWHDKWDGCLFDMYGSIY